MGSLTPKDFEYNLLSKFIIEALKLHGQDCIVYPIQSKVPDSDMDDMHIYAESYKTTILFVDVLTENKLKDSVSWSKESGSPVEAYIGLDNAMTIVKDTIIDITPNFYNNSAKFIVTNMYGQVNSVWLKVLLVPYRESPAVNLTNTESTIIDDKLIEEGVIIDRPKLNRDPRK